MGLKISQLPDKAAEDGMMIPASVGGMTYRLLVGVAGGLAKFLHKHEIADVTGLAASLAEKASLATQTAVFDTAVPTKAVTVAAGELQAYLDALPRLLTENLAITVTGTAAERIQIEDFYGSGWIELTGGTYTAGALVKNCSKVTFGLATFNGTLRAEKSFYVGVYSGCAFSGISNMAIDAIYGTTVHLNAPTITNCGIAAYGEYLGRVAVKGGTFSGNTTGARADVGGIVSLSGSAPDLLGGASNVKNGGLIVKANGTLL